MEDRKKYKGEHRMDRRSLHHHYYWPGIYHITIKVSQGLRQPLGRVVGDIAQPDGSADAPRVVLSEIGMMVEQELAHSICAHYPMVEVQDYVVMPDHLHAILVVHNRIVSTTGRETHLGQVVAGFKKGCNRRFWGWVEQWGKPTATGNQPAARNDAQPATRNDAQPAARNDAQPATRNDAQPGVVGLNTPGADGGSGCFAVYPQRHKVPSNGASGRTPLFSYGYVDVMPISEEQLEQQRRYIRNNPRSRLLRTTNRAWLQKQCCAVHTALSVTALKGYLQRECPSSQMTEEKWVALNKRLLTVPEQPTGKLLVVCDSYGNSQLLERKLLPVVCHRKDASLFAQQKLRCLDAARNGAVLVSARISKGEQTIMDEAISQSCPVILIEDNGFPKIYHPSEKRINLCAEGRQLLITPWNYQYRGADEDISVAECKTMNCLAQALSKTRDTWWKEE